tara:strand:+ start:594 stop:944 length:351 start_codon:yes stop_codon:yes gene_type:complete
MDIKTRLFNTEDKRMERVTRMCKYNNVNYWECHSICDETEEESEWVVEMPVMLATGLTDNDKNEIYYGDVYHVDGYGTLVINSIHDVMTLMEAKAESDLGDKLGDIYNNPELAGEE